MAADETVTFRIQPHNIEAEQALLGAILVNNEAYHRVSELLRPEHFFEPVHGRIYECCAQRIGRGNVADPVTLKLLFEEDEALRELDGSRYLSRLAHAAETIINAAEYGQIVHDLALKRGLIKIGEEVVNHAFDRATPKSGREQIESAERELFNLAQEGESQGEFRPFPQVLTAAIKHIESAWHKVGKVSGVPTRLTGLDQKLGGLQPSDLVILAGRPSMGKTAMAVTIAANAAAVENTSDDAGTRQAPQPCRGRVLAGDVGRAAGDPAALGPRPDRIRPSAPRRHRRGGVAGGGARQPGAGRDAAVHRRHARPVDRRAADQGPAPQAHAGPAPAGGRLSPAAARLEHERADQPRAGDHRDHAGPEGDGQGAQRAGAGAVAAVARRRIPRGQAPDAVRPARIGSIEQDADVVMFVFREEYYLSRAIPTQREGEGKEKFDLRYQEWFQRCQAVHNKAEVIIAKQRHGPIGNIQVQFDANFGQFNDLEPGNYPEHLYG